MRSALQTLLGAALALGCVAPASAQTTLPDGGSNEPEKSGFMKSINVGGGEYVAKDGTVFEADTGIDDGWMNTRSRSGVSVEGTDDDALYIDYGYGNFSYDIAVPNEGDYQVTLFLTEPWARKSGQRVFDVELEGSAFGSLNDIDLFGTTGTKWKALTLTETVHVSDGVLDIDLAGSVNYGIVSGISVLALLG